VQNFVSVKPKIEVQEESEESEDEEQDMDGIERVESNKIVCD